MTKNVTCGGIEGKRLLSTTCSGERRSTASDPVLITRGAGDGNCRAALVFRHLRIDAVGPSQDPARQVMDFLETGLAQEVCRFTAAHTRSAVGHDFFAGIELVTAFWQVACVNQ